MATRSGDPLASCLSGFNAVNVAAGIEISSRISNVIEI
jgi:hypothetical protein